MYDEHFGKSAYLTKGEFCLEKRNFSEKRQDLDFLETPRSVYIRFKS